jgi:hypothetical protein
MDLSKFKRVFQDIPECRTILVCCLSGANLIALRMAIGFWLSDKEKSAHLSLLSDVFEHMEWSENVGELILMGGGVDSRRVEEFMQESAGMRPKKMFPFVIMIRPPLFGYGSLVLWAKMALLSVKRSTKMTVTEASDFPEVWDPTPIATVDGFAADVAISIPITMLAQEAPQSQVGHATIDRAAAMSIFQPVLDNVIRIAIVRITINFVRYETGLVYTYKANDSFSIYLFESQDMTNGFYTKILEVSEKNWSPSSQVVTRVINVYSPITLELS